MNTRIKELAEQAGFQYIKDEGIGWAGNHNSSLPKFAELIAAEVISKAEDYGLGCDAVEQLKEDFGVEECL
jgi:ribose 5-phosphate isomerase RpiB